MRHGITETIKRALGDPKVTAVVLCGENEKFCGGKIMKDKHPPAFSMYLLNACTKYRGDTFGSLFGKILAKYNFQT